MASNPNLVPTQITDVNGRLTTVYRKKHDQRASKTALPAPATKVSGYDDSIKDAARRLKEIGFIPSEKTRDMQVSLVENLKTLSKHSPETLTELVEHIEDSDDALRESWRWSLTAYQLHGDINLTGKDAGHQIRSFYQRLFAIHKLVNLIQRHHPKYSPISETNTVIRRVTASASGLKDKDHKIIRALAVYFGIRNLSEEDVPLGIPRIDSKTIDYIADNIEAVEMNINELASRRTTDPKVIEMVINSHSAITAGNL